MTTENVSQAEGTGEKKSFGRYITVTVRIVLALMCLFFGVIGLFKPMSPPAETPENIKMVFRALTDAGYLKVVSGTELIVGVCLLLNRFVPLGLALFAPIVVGILTFHIFLAPASIVPGIVVAVIELYLAWAYRSAFCPMLRAKTTPG